MAKTMRKWNIKLENIVFYMNILIVLYVPNTAVCSENILLHDGVELHGTEAFAPTKTFGLVENITAIPPSIIENSCKAFIERYAVVTSGFTQCSIENARPLRFCEKCIDDFVLSKSVYNVIMNGLARDEKGTMCGQYILNADKIQLIAQTEAFIEKIWSDGHCENCFRGAKDENGTVIYHLKDDIKHFQKLANSTWDCFLNHSQASIRPFGPMNITSNNTVCKDCDGLYKDINNFYTTLEDKYSHSVCMDVVDMMNYTRMLWSGDFQCSRPKGDIVAVLVLSGIFCALPIAFYVAAKIYGTKQEHKIIQQKRYGTNQNPETSGTSGN